jgi:hypothetical protein
MGEWRYISTIFDLVTIWRSVVSFTPRPLYPRGMNPLVLGGPQSLSGWRGAKKSVLPLPGNEPRPSSPSLYRLSCPGFWGRWMMNLKGFGRKRCWPNRGSFRKEGLMTANLGRESNLGLHRAQVESFTTTSIRTARSDVNPISTAFNCFQCNIDHCVVSEPTWSVSLYPHMHTEYDSVITEIINIPQSDRWLPLGGCLVQHRPKTQIIYLHPVGPYYETVVQIDTECWWNC